MVLVFFSVYMHILVLWLLFLLCVASRRFLGLGFFLDLSGEVHRLRNYSIRVFVLLPAGLENLTRFLDVG